MDEGEKVLIVWGKKNKQTCWYIIVWSALYLIYYRLVCFVATFLEGSQNGSETTVWVTEALSNTGVLNKTKPT